METLTKIEVIEKLQKQVLAMQRFRNLSEKESSNTGLGPLEAAFPNKIFPTGAVHEFISVAQEDASATNGFIAGILGRLMQTRGLSLWISNKRTVFPPALKAFGINPDRIIFIDLARQKDVLWAIEEALKSGCLSAVIGELSQLSFTESRRLQLAVEESRVTGFIHRYNPVIENTVACVTRWKIKPIASYISDGMPGLGFPRWHVELLKVRNGKPGTWQLEWFGSGFRHITPETFSLPQIQKRKTG